MNRKKRHRCAGFLVEIVQIYQLVYKSFVIFLRWFQISVISRRYILLISGLLERRYYIGPSLYYYIHSAINVLSALYCN